MTGWNYRIVAVEHFGEIEYGIYEVYYDDAGPVARTESPVAFAGSTFKELIASYDIALEAFSKDVLTDKDFNFDNA